MGPGSGVRGPGPFPLAQVLTGPCTGRPGPNSRGWGTETASQVRERGDVVVRSGRPGPTFLDPSHSPRPRPDTGEGEVSRGPTGLAPPPREGSSPPVTEGGGSLLLTPACPGEGHPSGDETRDISSGATSTMSTPSPKQGQGLRVSTSRLPLRVHPQFHTPLTPTVPYSPVNPYSDLHNQPPLVTVHSRTRGPLPPLGTLPSHLSIPASPLRQSTGEVHPHVPPFRDDFSNR